MEENINVPVLPEGDFNVFPDFDPSKFETPCVIECKQELIDEVCPQCKRTKDEIVNWYYYTPEERQEITLAVKTR